MIVVGNITVGGTGQDSPAWPGWCAGSRSGLEPGHRQPRLWRIGWSAIPVRVTADSRAEDVGRRAACCWRAARAGPSSCAPTVRGRPARLPPRAARRRRRGRRPATLRAGAGSRDRRDRRRAPLRQWPAAARGTAARAGRQARDGGSGRGQRRRASGGRHPLRAAARRCVFPGERRAPACVILCGPEGLGCGRHRQSGAVPGRLARRRRRGDRRRRAGPRPRGPGRACAAIGTGRY